MKEIFDSAFSDRRINDDFWLYLVDEGLVHNQVASCRVNGHHFSIARDTEVEITTKVLQLNYHPEHAGVRVVVAVGGLRSENCGILEAVYFFAKLYYSGEGSSWHLNRVDFDTWDGAL